jgi:GMP synthase-like glutamine amidotransferase
MRAHIIQHVSFEGPGAIANELERRGTTITVHHVWDGAPLPSAEDVDLLVSMGGPMSVHDGHEYHWIAEEQALIRELAAANRPILGVCLGAQQMSMALGGGVVASPQREIGWYPVVWEDVPWLDAVRSASGSAPGDTAVLHWHGEMVVRPVGTLPVATSSGCPSQGFWMEPRCVALQFHLEANSETLASMIAGNAAELDQHGDDPLVTTPPALWNGFRDHANGARELLGSVFDWLLR